MAVMTNEVLNKIREILDNMYPPLPSEQVAEKAYLLTILPATEPAATEVALNAFGVSLARFFEIRHIVALGSKNTPIDEIHTLVAKMLPTYALLEEDQTMLSMLREITANTTITVTTKSTQRISSTEQEMGDAIPNAPKPNYYELTADPATSLAQLYPLLTDKNPTKKYPLKKGAPLPLIHLAIKYDRSSLLNVLIPAGEKADQRVLTCPDDNKDTPLHYAGRHLKAWAVPILLAGGADVNAARGARSLSALTLAIDQVNPDIDAQVKTVAALLLAKGINVPHKTTFGDTAWSLAAGKQRTDLMVLLLPHLDLKALSVVYMTYQDIFFGKSVSVQQWAVAAYKKDIIKALMLSNKIDFNLENLSSHGDKTCILDSIAQHGWSDGLEALTIPEAALNKPSDYGYTPLQWAIYCKHFEVAKILLDKGAKNIGYGSDATILDMAARACWLEGVKRLVDEAKLVITSSVFITPMLYGGYLRHACVPIIEFLLNHSSVTAAMLNTPVAAGGNVLTRAIAAEFPEVIKLLLKDPRVMCPPDISDPLKMKAVQKGWIGVNDALTKREVTVTPARMAELEEKNAALEKRVDEQAKELQQLKEMQTLLLQRLIALENRPVSTHATSLPLLLSSTSTVSTLTEVSQTQKPNGQRQGDG